MNGSISKSELLSLLRSIVMIDPEFIGEAVGAMVVGIQDSLKAANIHAADMETLFIMSALQGNLPKKIRDREYLATILERWAPESRFNFALTIKELRVKP